MIIDRIPFPRPNEPVLQARRDRAGKAAFGTIDLPRAATLLAQGAGASSATALTAVSSPSSTPAWQPPAATVGTHQRARR